MARAIRVPQGFREDFEYYCTRAGLDAGDRDALRDAVRGDFEAAGAWVAEAAIVYRFCDKQWGGDPTVDQVRAYLDSVGWSPSDPTIFDRYGPALLARVCASVAGLIPIPGDVGRQ